MKTISLAAVSLFLAGGCDKLCDNCDTPLGTCAPTDVMFYPLEPGAWWRDSVIDPLTDLPQCPDKVVSIGELGPIVSAGAERTPLRPDVTAFVAYSDRENALGRRWQSIEDNAVYREVDEWFKPKDDGTPGERSKIVFYCPRALRAPGGVIACAGTHFTEHYRQGTLTAATPEDWPACLALPVARDTCELQADHPGCVMERAEVAADWTIEAIDEPLSTPLGDFKTLRMREVVRVDGELDDTQVQWWAAGLGKIKEAHEPLEEEFLVDSCVPALGCDRPAPQWAEMKTHCQ